MRDNFAVQDVEGYWNEAGQMGRLYQVGALVPNNMAPGNRQKPHQSEKRGETGSEGDVTIRSERK